MRDLQDRLPALLHGLAGEMPADLDRLGRRTLRRARIRRAVTATSSTLLVAIVVAGGVLGIRALRDAAPPITVGEDPSPAAPTGVEAPAFPGIWVATTPEQLADIQSSVDDGHRPWQLDAAMTAEAFAVNVLGWEPEAVESSIEDEASDRAVLAVWHRDRDELVTEVSLGKLGVTGPSGVWTVIRAESDLIVVEPRLGPGSLRLTGSMGPGATGSTASFQISDGTFGQATVEAGEASGGPEFDFEIATRSSDGSLTAFLFAVDAGGDVLAAEAFAIAVPLTTTPSPSIDLTDLPPDVAATAQRILDGVRARDVDALALLIDPDAFVYNFDDGSDPTPAWRVDPTVLDPILKILELPYVVEEIEGHGTFYIWPYFTEDGALDRITDRERADLRALGFTDEQIRRMVEFGGYLGPRLAIDEQGRWRNYVTGGD